MNKKFIIGVLVINKFGVLSRVVRLFSQRSYNIDSLAVGETEDSSYSRITIVATGDEYIKNQMVVQLQKLVDVKKVILSEENNSFRREHVLIKFKNAHNPALIDLIARYGGVMMDMDEQTLSVEFTSDEETTQKLLEDAKKHTILELCRSGAISLGRGNENTMNINF
ncbi:MAG: acetolactate synthase small subunit [Brevinema sp.]